MSEFHFKQFSVAHNLCAMKVGTDSVLLGAWSVCKDAENILDVGTGSGILALMAAQRNGHALIYAVDIEQNAVNQARENVEKSPWANRIFVELADIRNWNPGKKFDCILCNPPFYRNGLLSPEQSRNQARQTACLSFEHLIKACTDLLAEHGRFHVIIPAESCDDFVHLCWERNLLLAQKTWVHTKENKPAKRVLLAFQKDVCAYPLSDKLILNSADNMPTEEYRALTEDFYLHLR